MEKPIRLIIHADDAGMSHGSNVAVMDNLLTGAVTSASVMVPCPWFPEFAAFAKENSHLDIGIHLTLTSEWVHYRWRPVADGVPSLLDSEGFMHKGPLEVVERATVADVEKECRAQIERALLFGVKPTHVDSHMFTLLMPKFLDVCRRVAADYGLPYLRPLAFPMRESAPKSAQGFLSRWEKVQDFIRETPGPVVDQILIEGPASADGYEARLAHYHNLLRSLKPGLNEWLCHPAINHPESGVIMWGGWHIVRDDEHRIFSEASTRALIKELGIQLTTWREVAALG